MSSVRARPATLWDAGTRPAGGALRLASALIMSAAVVDLVLSDGLGLFHDLVFATVCVGLALLVRPRDFFSVGVFPPLAMLAVVLLLAIAEPGAVADERDGVVQATVSGLSSHGIALALGYGACLALLAVRRQYLTTHPR
ncbi:hypothetical protein L615_002400000620 [Nocardioides sp. J9]|uniref:DUF6542 domain-containing protein n=1 Tax=unclassified Nocardioides TaxID=2615069 RepID=UPI0004B33516|nr:MULTISPECIES: DUF6542 domain-containing protein [unclassified Nocardioides]TWG99816.1 hypothetical protein L615_002400000620 [Nocardioides sp. J9]